MANLFDNEDFSVDENGIHYKDEWRLAMDAAIVALRRPEPDPVTGLVPCGCGGEVYPHYQFGWDHGESEGQAFEVSTGCDGCGTRTKPRYGHYVNGIDEDDTESESKRDWNISHGYTAPSRLGAIRDGVRINKE